MMHMKIFISHSLKDYELAKYLKNILEEEESIKESFIFEDRKKLGTQISEKITNEIDSSDYFVALITANSIESASINQEYGYAQAKNLQKIPFLEDGTEEGIMIYGTDKVTFSKDTFQEKCLEVKQYLLDNGIPNKINAEEKSLMQKSAYYRQSLELEIIEFLNGLYYRFNIGQNNHPAGLSSSFKESRKYIKEIKTFFEKEIDDVINYLAKIDFSMFGKLDHEVIRCKKKIEQAERFPHTELPQNEIDLIVKLKEGLSDINEEDLDFGKYCQDIYHPDLEFNFNNCEQLMKDKKYKFQVTICIRMNYYDLKKTIDAMVGLLELYLDYRQKFGNVAFKNTIGVEIMTKDEDDIEDEEFEEDDEEYDDED